MHQEQQRQAVIAEQRRQEAELTSTMEELQASGLTLNADMSGWSHEQKMSYLKQIKKICEELESDTVSIEALQAKVSAAVATANIARRGIACARA